MIRTTLVMLGAMALAGCAADYATNNSSPVLLLLADINGGSPLSSDVVTSTGGVKADTVKILLAVRTKNPKIEAATIPLHVILERYEVRYYRSDGRGVEGVDVPYAISGNMTTEIDAKTTGTTEVELEVVRTQAKLEPPLSNLQGPDGKTLGGQAVVLSCMAKIILHGRTVAGEAVSTSGYLQIDFADSVDSTT